MDSYIGELNVEIHKLWDFADDVWVYFVDIRLQHVDDVQDVLFVGIQLGRVLLDQVSPWHTQSIAIWLIYLGKGGNESFC